MRTMRLLFVVLAVVGSFRAADAFDPKECLSGVASSFTSNGMEILIDDATVGRSGS